MLDYGIIAAHDAVSNNGIAIEDAEDRWRLRAVKSRDQRPRKNAMRENGVTQECREIGEALACHMIDTCNAARVLKQK